MCAQKILVIGGAASGKSDSAEKICVYRGLERVYLATAEAWDDEMRTKIAQHRTRRGPGWITHEVPLALAEAIATARAGQIVLVDCATLWLSNIMLADRDVATEARGLVEAIGACAADLVIVTNEVGQGIVPDNALARRFRAAQGRLNRDLAARCNTVVGVMAGLPFVLKGAMPEALT